MRKGIFLAAFILFLLVVAPVRADIAPPAEPPGANPLPGSEPTQVRMMEETVRIAIQAETREDTLGQALVNAEFIMRNLGSADESMAVRFPLGIPNGWGDIAAIDRIDVWVDGAKVSTRRISGMDPAGSSEEVPWAEFDMLFPVGEDVKVTVAYELEAAGEFPYIWLNYIFSSGAGWKDSIGKAELVVTFPYAIDPIFLINCVDYVSNCTVPGGTIKGKQISWTYSDFEPQPGDNFMIAYAAPSVWQQVLKEEERVASVPGDGEAWGRLGKLYKSLVFSPHGWRGFRNYYYQEDPGVEQLFTLADQAYAKAVTLLPQDALWHAGYAELLGYYAEFAGYTGVDTLSLKLKALQELHRAIEIAPDDETVKEIAYGLTWPLQDGVVLMDDGFDFPWLTATPMPTATQAVIVESTGTPISTLTLAQSRTPAAIVQTPSVGVEAKSTQASTDGKESNGGLQICGVAILLPFLMIFGVKMGHNRGRKA